MDYEQVNKFLDFFNRDVYVVQTFSEGVYKATNQKELNGRVVDTAAKVLVGTKECVVEKFSQYQQWGAGVFLQINKGYRRGAAHINEVAAVFVDLDGTPLAHAQQVVKDGFPAPHFVTVSSPEKYHLYWLIKDCEKKLFIKLQKALAEKFGGDPCVHNLDRVMRIPGTACYKYDKPYLSVVSMCKPQEPIDAIVMADHLDDGVPDFSFDNAPDVPGLNKENTWAGPSKMYDVDELPAGGRTQALISMAGALVAQNKDWTVEEVMRALRVAEATKRPSGDPAKTEASWQSEILPGVQRFVANREEEKEAAERKGNEMLIAVGATAQAFAESLDTVPVSLEQFRDRFVYVSAENKVFDLCKPANAMPWRVPDFKMWAATHRFTGKKVSISSKWLASAEHRRTAHISGYRPYAHELDPIKKLSRRIYHDPSTGVLAYNTYEPPKLVPKDGSCDVFKDHIRYLVNDDEDNLNRFLDWLAFGLQYPELRIPWAPVIISEQGVGKGWVAECIKKLAGQHNVNVIEKDKFKDSTFNGYLAESTFIVVDEIKANAAAVDRMKAAITEPQLEVNVKYGSQKKCDLYCNFLFFSNHDDALAMDERERRFWVIKNVAYRKEPVYYTKIWRWLETDGPAQLLNYLLKRDVSSFEYAAPPPVTVDQQEMTVLACDDMDREIIEGIRDGSGCFKSDIITTVHVRKHLEMLFKRALESAELDTLRVRLGKKGRTVGRINYEGRRLTVYAVRNAPQYAGKAPRELIPALEAADSGLAELRKELAPNIKSVDAL